MPAYLRSFLFVLIFMFCNPLLAGDLCVGEFESYPVVAKGELLNRLEAMALHKEMMNSPIHIQMPTGWDGDVNACSVGNLSKEFRKYSTLWLNYLRYISDIRQVVFNCASGEEAQSAALMMAANTGVNHYPPRTWLCTTPTGRAGLATSNLFGGGKEKIAPASLINTWFRSPGHRGFLISPFLYNYALGVATASGDTYAAAKVVGTTDPNNPPPPHPILSWPPAGLYVYEDILNSDKWGPEFNFKHLIHKAEGIELKTANVSFEINGENIPLEVSHPKGKRLGFQLDFDRATEAFTRIFKETYAARLKVTIIPQTGNPLPYEMIWISKAGVNVNPVGEVLKRQAATNKWVNVKQQATFTDPVMYLQSETYNSQEPSVVVGRRAPRLAISLRTPTSDEKHKEKIQVLIVEAGEHQIEGGLHVKAQHIDVAPEGTSISYQDFSSRNPIVLAQIISNEGQGTYIVEANAQPETQSYLLSVHGLNGEPITGIVPVDIIMIEKKESLLKGAQYTIQAMDKTVSSTPQSLTMNADFDTPFLFGSVFSHSGNKPAILRISELTKGSAKVFFEEGNNSPSQNAEAGLLQLASELGYGFLYPKPPTSFR